MKNYRLWLFAFSWPWIGPVSVWAAPIDEFRISSIEQELHDLQNAIREQARVLSELQQRGAVGAATMPPTLQAATPNTGQRWLSAASWQKLKPGMSELEVIELLGPPNQLRADDNGARQLLYALEIGRSGFLSGKVLMRDGKVVQIEQPVLR